MRRTLFGLAAAGTLALSASSSADVSMTAIIRDFKLSPTEAAAAVIIADALDLDATFVINTGRRSGVPLVALGPAFVISRNTGVGVLDVCKKRRGRGWGVVAKEMGMHPGTFNKMRVQGDFDRVVWVNLANKRYGYREGDFKFFESEGMGRGDVLAAVVLSNGDRSKMKTVATDWKKDKSWKSTGKSPSGSSGKSDTGKADKGGPAASKGPSKAKDHGGGGNGKGKGKH